MLKCHLIFLFKEGRVDLPENYRSIAINNPWSKILWKIIHTRLVKYAEERNLLPALQFGFRSKRSTLSAIFTLKKIILDNFKLKKKTHVYFIDLKKAFPSVSRKLLFKRLYDLGFSIELLKLINYYYNNLKTYIKDGEKISDGYFYSRIGLPEGHVLSPILFALYVGDLELEQSDDEIWIVRKDGSKIWIPYIFYCDDLVILANSKANLIKKIGEFKIFCQRKELNINIGKTKIMIFSKGQLSKVDKEEVHIDGSVIKLVTEYKYLGMILTPQLTFTKHLQRSINKARAKV